MLGQKDKIYPLHHMLHLFSLSKSEKSMNGPSRKILRQNENSRHQPITRHEESGEKKASSNHTFINGCKCGLGTVGEVKKNETKSRIIKGYEPEKRPWMVFIEVNLQSSSKLYCCFR